MVFADNFLEGFTFNKLDFPFNCFEYFELIMAYNIIFNVIVFKNY